jgi:HK97 family phage prohead protease
MIEMPQNERRTIPMTEIRAESDGKITGYAAVFNQKSELLYGSFREVIKPGAFSNTLQNDIRALWNHDTAYVLGRNTAGTLQLKEDDRGLRVEISPPDTQWARDLMVSIKRGDISQMSFGFNVRKDSWTEPDGQGVSERELLDVNLHEVSVVTFPAYPQTSVSARSVENVLDDVAELVALADEDKLSAETLSNLKRQFERLENKISADNARIKADLDHKQRSLDLLLI